MSARSCWWWCDEPASRLPRERGDPASSFFKRLAMGGCVYMMSDRYRGVIYTGVTAHLTQRVEQHRSGAGSKFVRKHRFHRLVYIEVFEDISDAIVREKRVKKWLRPWKIELIEKMNPEWRDLSGEIHF